MNQLCPFPHQYVLLLFAGAMTGAAMSDKAHADNWGSLVVVIDPALFGSRDAFLAKVDEMNLRVKMAKRLPGVDKVFLPGERGDRMEMRNKERGYLLIKNDTIIGLKEVAGADILQNFE